MDKRQAPNAPSNNNTKLYEHKRPGNYLHQMLNSPKGFVMPLCFTLRIRRIINLTDVNDKDVVRGTSNAVLHADAGQTKDISMCI